ncbi:hypothetical protein [Rurimicrobium arvi]|uniref:Lipocalin-like domain-containing protein n=1 Tax=Rurimicrobium arvi TaxID=2049916 RepID=A0ABP8MIL8_9BACT
MKKLLLPVAALLIFAEACKKDKKTTTPTTPGTVDTPYSKYTALTTDKWQVTAIYMTATTGDTSLDYYSTLETCATNNYYIFNTDQSITLDEGATKCDDTVAQRTTDGNWTLSSDTTKFTLKDSKILPFSGAVTFNVGSLTKTTLQLTKDTSLNYSGITITGTVHTHFKKVN